MEKDVCNPKPDAKAKTVNACYHISNDKEGYEVWQFKDGDFVKVSERVGPQGVSAPSPKGR